MRTVAIIVIMLLAAGAGYGQGLFESAGAGEAEKPRLEWSGYARGSAYGGGGSFDYATAFGEAALQGKFSQGKAFLFADVRLREGAQFGQVGTTLQLKEAYAGYQSERLDVYLGNQIITWGRADGFNPTNCITPQDYFLLTPEPDDQTLPNFLLRARYHISPQAQLELIGIPFFQPSVYRYDLFALEGDVRFAAAALPDQDWKSGALGARLNIELPRAGFALSYFNGYDPFHGFAIQAIDLSQLLQPAIVYQPSFYRKSMAGADFALPLGNWIARGELAGSRTRGYHDQMHVPNPELAYVLGLEREIWGITAIAQYIGKQTFHFQELIPPVLEEPLTPENIFKYANAQIGYESTLINRKIFLQQEASNHAFSLALNRAFAHDALRVELASYYNLTSEEYLLRPSLKWQLSDALSATMGAQFMGGPQGFIFNYSKEVLNGVFAELKVRF
jgi:hypothetical protein